MCLTSRGVVYFSLLVLCSKTRTCGRKKGHPGKCNSERECADKFWEKSPFFKLRESQGDLSRKASKIEAREAEVGATEKDLLAKQEELKALTKCAQEKVDAASEYDSL